ncbi:MAG: hypothetical protein Q9160_001476 [Pyrenula sp. 1 TL-2023]
MDIANGMAADTVKALNDASNPIGKLAKGVFDALFAADELEDVKTRLGAVAKIDSENEVVIFCDEEHHAMIGDAKSKFSTWDDTTWEGKDAGGNVAFVKIGREVILSTDPNSALPDPRQKIYASEKRMDAYTSIGDRDLAGQFHIVLCPSYFEGNSESDGVDTRSINEINTKGLKKDLGLNVLDNIDPSSRTILHEFMHVVGGPARDVNGKPHFTFSSSAAPQWIQDTPGVPCYGFTWCYEIKKKYDSERDPQKRLNLALSRNADSFVSLCLAVAVQPKVNSAAQPVSDGPGVCMWFTGKVDPDTLQSIARE